MAARTRRIFVDEKTKSKIRTTKLIQRLQGHILDNIDMSSSQVSAALGLIKKVLPDMAAVTSEITGLGGRPIDMNWNIKFSDVIQPRLTDADADTTEQT